MTLTKAQEELLRKLENGYEVTFKAGHYIIVGEDEDVKIWPSTFAGLYDKGLVKKMSSGNFTAPDGGA